MRKLIRGGSIVTSEGCTQGDVLIEGETVAAVGVDLGSVDAQVIDAEGMLVRPGGIDVHTHLDWPFQGTVTSDDFETGSKAAAAGGTTTIVDFCTQVQGTSLQESLELWHERAREKAVIDYGFHIAITDLTPDVFNEISSLPAAGVTSVKCFLAYKGGYMIDDGGMFRIMREASRNGILTMAHCENGDVIDLAMKDAIASGRCGPNMQPLVRSMEAEAEATARAIHLAGMAGSPIYIVHCSCRDALRHIQLARNAGQPVFAETCTHYLVLDDRVYSSPGFESAKYVCAPPIRPAYNQDYLWHGLQNGSLQSVNSDHCPLNYKTQKTMGIDDFRFIPNGAPGIEDRLSILFSEGVLKRRISLSKWVDMTSTQQAKLFGMFPRKGTIRPGSDADIVVWDPRSKRTIAACDQFQNVDYNAFEGMTITGQPAVVLCRGEAVFQGRRFTGKLGHGRFVRRSAFTLDI